MAKRDLGQYYTVNNPFTHPLFKLWMGIVGYQDIIEPFAGANNIVKLMQLAGYNNKWHCYDIEPSANNVTPEYKVIKEDTITNFPLISNVCVTNPPYLGKSSARRRKIYYPWEEDDLYKVCLNVMLNNCEYVAAIIPESFITARIHIERLYGVISLNCTMFDDTECPVCLAMFVPKAENECEVWTMNERLGTLQSIQNNPLTGCTEGYEWVFNDKQGEIGAKTVDSQTSSDCKFFHGDRISPDKIKISSRAFTRISGLPNGVDIDEFLLECNKILSEYRKNTKDVLMTSFKGLRKDGKYRRRLDFRTVRCIMNKAVENIKTR